MLLILQNIEIGLHLFVFCDIDYQTYPVWESQTSNITIRLRCYLKIAATFHKQTTIRKKEGHFTVFCISQWGKSEGNNQLCSLIANIQ